MPGLLLTNASLCWRAAAPRRRSLRKWHPHAAPEWACLVHFQTPPRTHPPTPNGGRLSGYIFDEKVAIARTYLEPQVGACCACRACHACCDCC